MKELALLFLIFLLVPSLCLAQAAKKIPVAISHSGHDQVGQSVAFALKEVIRGSQGFFLVDHETLPKNPRIVVDLVSMDSSGGETKGLRSAIAVVLIYDNPQTPVHGIFLTSSVLTCGRDRVESCAKNTLPAIDQAVDNLRKNWPNLWKTL